ncbi:unannotated protein [freshwater metagenome]|uniref:Unannotated protein n=1 Tax=freshwater metagenome TaxID=449393 RepID=A0A6J7HPS3_9ZZZZ|nr:DUF2804 family protein [Actinomycetota bacterium]
MTSALPLRSDGTTRPAGLPLPPARMPLWRDGRPLKRWTYVGVYGPELMLCAAQVHVGGLPQAFWAVLDRASGELTQGTTFLPGRVCPDAQRLRVHTRAAQIDLELAPAGEPVEVTSPHGASFIWTRKLPVHATGSVTAGGRVHRVDAPGLVDMSAGYHARVTSWEWSAGAGRTPDGRDVRWNLVRGIHDAPRRSERTVWIDGAAQETVPARFTDDLSTVSFERDAAALRFSAEAQRARTDRLLVVRSSYRQPFGTFAGTLPGAVTLTEGFGVMERHDARW